MCDLLVDSLPSKSVSMTWGWGSLRWSGYWNQWTCKSSCRWTFLCSSAILEGNMEKHNVQWFMFEGGLNLTASCEFTKRGDLSKLKPEKGKKKIVGALQCSMFSMRIAWGGADNARRGLLKCWDAVTLRVSEADSIFFPVSFVGLESKLEQVTSSPVDRYGHALLERKDWICQLESWIW